MTKDEMNAIYDTVIKGVETLHAERMLSPRPHAEKLLDRVESTLYKKDREVRRLNKGVRSPQHHATATLTLHGKSVAVDLGMVELIEIMNRMEGIRTDSCCQGESNRARGFSYAGYVSFGGEGAAAFTLLMVDRMMKVSREQPIPAPARVESPPMIFYVEVWDPVRGFPTGSLFRWNPDIYPRVLQAVKEIATGLSAEEPHP